MNKLLLSTGQRICAALVVISFTWLNAVAQPAATLSAALTPTVIVSGPAGSLQQVQYSTNLTDPNGWKILSHIRLAGGPKPFYDTTASGVQRFYRTLTVGLADTNLVWILPGTFLMGSPESEQGRLASEGPQTLVTLTDGFFMGQFEVRNLDWLAIMGSIPLASDATLTNYLQRPVRHIAWSQATNYCALRTAAEISVGKIPAGWTYRLPTEAQWEYAARAGSNGPFAFGNELRSDAVRVDAVFNGDYPYPTNVIPVGPVYYANPQVVGSCAPNGFGLYNVHGNVAEWCLDGNPGSSVPGYPGGSVTNPISGSDGAYKFVRGGSYFDTAAACRSAKRSLTLGLNTPDTTGLRVILVPANP
ncbi:MAG: formylglycine-generating enzyme family protein [Limisphaerales bacterium]